MRARRQALAATITQEAWGATYRAALPAGCAGGWIRLRAESAAARCWMKLEVADAARGQLVREAFLQKPRGRGGRQCRTTLVHVPKAAGQIVLRVFGQAPRDIGLSVQRLGRVETAALMLGFGWRLLPACLRGSPLGVVGRSRAVLGQAPARAGDVPPYGAWIEFFEAPVPSPAPDGLAMTVVVAGADAAAAVTLKSLAAQSHPPARILRVRCGADWDHADAGWMVVVQAGEVLHAHALAWFAWARRAWPAADFITADCDALDQAGLRHTPLFKPGADARMRADPLLSWGACAVMLGHAGLRDVRNAADAADARWRLAQHAMQLAHIPRILTHCATLPPIAVPAPHGWRGERPPDAALLVTAIVPSALRSRTAAACIEAVARSGGGALHIIVAVSAPDGVNPKILHRVSRLPNVTVLPVPMPVFNYAAVNNRAAVNIKTPLMLLLNDDVAPQNAAWLGAMLDEMRDPSIGVVGARLLYGNGMVQHEGVILGLANLAEHAGRLRAGDDPGPFGMGLRTRRVSAVTAACMLIRTSLFHQLGGMDEKFVIALNDVDLCLRAGEAGAGIMYCAGAVLTHYESLSLGRHYHGPRAELEAFETKRLRTRWPAMVAADPYYNPQSSLMPGQEWRPGFPPRGPGFTPRAGDSGAVRSEQSE